MSFIFFCRSITLLEHRGVLCLVVGAPNYAEIGLPQTGRVYLIPIDDLLNKNDGHILNVDQASTLILKGKRMMTKFGWSLASVGSSNDAHLLIGAPVEG